MVVSSGCNRKGEKPLMQIFLLELKRVLKTRTTLILIVIALLLSGLMAYFPISYVQYTYTDKSGKNVTITGMKAIQSMKKLMVQGKITQRKIDEAVREYHECVNKYGNIYADKVPQNIYNKKILAYRYITDRIKENFFLYIFFCWWLYVQLWWHQYFLQNIKVAQIIYCVVLNMAEENLL